MHRFITADLSGVILNKNVFPYKLFFSYLFMNYLDISCNIYNDEFLPQGYMKKKGHEIARSRD